MCEQCGSGDLHTDNSVLLLSFPPKLQVTCRACGHVSYRVDGEDLAEGEFELL